MDWKQWNWQRILAMALIALGSVALVFLGYAIVQRLHPDSSTPQEELAQSEQAVEPPEAQVAEIPIGPYVSYRAPEFSLRTLDGETVSLSDYRGFVVILDFWASWCTPCKLSMPRLESQAASYANDVVLLGVNLDRSEIQVISYLAATDFDQMIVLWQSYAHASRVKSTYRVYGIPRTFLIGRDGIIYFAGHPANLTDRHIEALL